MSYNNEIVLERSELEVKPAGVLIVLTGPSGVGKTALANEAVNSLGNIHRIVTYTTREIRDGEREGVDYHFLNRDDFLERERNCEFAETVRYGNNFYGTLKSSFLPVLEGQSLVWVTDMSRAANLESMFDKFRSKREGSQILNRTTIVLVGVSRLYSLWKRYNRRGGDRKSFVTRLRHDWEIWKENRSKFPEIVINDNDRLVEAKNSLLSIIYRTQSAAPTPT